MSRIIKSAQVLRRNWKKSTFFFGVLAYGSSYLIDRYKTFQMMRAYCEEARKYGEKPLPQMTKPKHVTVILNPEANYRKSNVQFEKFAAPLLHLAGFKVSVFQTEKEKQAQELMQVMSNTDAVLVAGGDGTLHETVTGLLRRPGVENESLPLGIIPLGKTNTVAKYLFGSKSASNAQLMAEAVMAVIRETTIKLDVLKVQYKNEAQPIYAMSSFEQGIFADIDPLVQKYWYLGALKDKFTYFIHSLKDWKSIEIEALEYVAPCDGCSKCFVPSKRKETIEHKQRWWSVFVPKIENKEYQAALEKEKLIASRVNENCGDHIELVPAYSNLSISISDDPRNTENSNSLWIKIFPKTLSTMQFISTGLNHRKSKHQDSTGTATILNAKKVIIENDKSVQIKSSTNQTEFILDAANSNTETLAETTSTESTTETACTDFTAEPVSTESTSYDQSNLVVFSGPEQSNSENPDQIELISKTTESEIASDNSDETKPSDSTQSNLEDKNNPDTNFYSYIDKEKYARASCIISLLPKQVTVYA